MRQEDIFDGFFNPKSVAVIGASRNPARIGHNLVANLLRLQFRGRIYVIHPQGGELLGIPTFRTIKDLPEVPDLAVIGVPQDLAPELLRECASKGIKRAVIVAGGFSEAGEEGRKAQEEMRSIVREYRMRAVGPNALSPINPMAGLAVSFHPIENITPGGTSLIFQSGLYEPRLEWLVGNFGLRINKLMDLGNKMDVNEVEVMDYMLRDPQTKVIGIHLESAEGGARELWRTMKSAAIKHIPVVVLKGGRSESGARAAASHTGVMARFDDSLFQAALRQAGAIKADHIEDFFDLCKALERMSSRKMMGPRIAFATLPGGEGVIVMDLCEMMGLRPAVISPSSIEKVRGVFPRWDIGGNPFDLGVCLQFHNPVKVYDLYLEAMLQDPGVDAIALMLPRWASRLPQEFLKPFERAFEAPKPTVVWIPGMFGGESPGLRHLEDNGIPVFPSPEKAIRALSCLFRFQAFTRGLVSS